MRAMEQLNGFTSSQLEWFESRFRELRDDIKRVEAKVETMRRRFAIIVATVAALFLGLGISGGQAFARLVSRLL